MLNLHELPTRGEDCQRVAMQVQPDDGAWKDASHLYAPPSAVAITWIDVLS
jgi:hypothetical protein